MDKELQESINCERMVEFNQETSDKEFVKMLLMKLGIVDFHKVDDCDDEVISNLLYMRS